MIILPILTISLIHFPLRGWKYVHFELGSRGFKVQELLLKSLIRCKPSVSLATPLPVCPSSVKAGWHFFDINLVCFQNYVNRFKYSQAIKLSLQFYVYSSLAFIRRPGYISHKVSLRSLVHLCVLFGTLLFKSLNRSHYSSIYPDRLEGCMLASRCPVQVSYNPSHDAQGLDYRMCACVSADRHYMSQNSQCNHPIDHSRHEL